ncbi:MAG: hypothetical protein RL701_6465 [Pseudomonadota bacterium]|jgi:hypothetical protein
MLASNDLTAATALRVSKARWLRGLLALVAALYLGSLQTAAARSGSDSGGTTLAFDGDAQLPISIDGVGTGGGFGIRFGTELRMNYLSVNPEIGFGYTGFSDDWPPKVYRGIVGVRLGLGSEYFRMGMLAHFGFAHVSWEWQPTRVGRVGDGSVQVAPRLFDYSHTSFTYDFGGFLEVSPTPTFTIGVHVVYNRVGDEEGQIDSLQWMSLGVHMSFLL